MFRNFLRKYLFLVLIIGMVLFFVIFKISGSSVGMWNRYFYGSSYQDKNLLFGQPRFIRSDEWMVETPLLVSESKQNYSEFNSTMGLGQKLVFTHIPIKNLSFVFKPYNWFFLFLNVESAFAFRWWFGVVSLISSVYLISIYFSKNIYFSVLMSLISFFTPFFQWWSGYRIFAYGFLIYLLIIKILNFKNIRNLFFRLYLFSYLSLCFIFEIYPPFQVPIVILFLLMTIGYLINHKEILCKDRTKKIVIGFLISILIIGSIVFTYFSIYKEQFNIVSNTAYPGKRLVTGGDLSFFHLFNGFYNIQLLDDNKIIPVIFGGNQCESSSFFLITVLLLPVFIIDLFIKFKKRKKIDFIILFLIFYELFIIIWCLFGFPEFIAKLTLMSYSPSKRAIVGLGVANIFTIIYFFSSKYKLESFKYKKFCLIFYSVLLFIFYLLFGFYLKINYPEFIQNNFKIIAISFIVFILSVTFLFQKRKLFLITFLMFSFFTTYRINPLYKGLSPIMNGELSVKLQSINNKDKNSRYISYGNILLGDYIRANGLPSIDGIGYPDLNLWKKFDIGGKNDEIYNRYAHASFFVPNETDLNLIKFKLTHEDSFSVMIDPCNSILKDLNVNYFLFLNKVDYKCLNFLESIDYPNMPIFIYKRN